MADAIRVSLATRHPRSRRFELMCLVGGHLARRTTDGIIAATTAATAQQKLQRAFAAEVLCPIEGILGMIGGKTANEDLMQVVADRYDVSPMVVEWQLRNRAPQAPISARDFAP
jgi:Zn-dependent peptidase ImmA (M78 family)